MSYIKKIKPVDFSPDKQNCEMVFKGSTGGKIKCATAFKLSEKLGILKSEIGNYADYLDLRLEKCQIGLFGHGEKGKLVKKIDNPDEKIQEQVTMLQADGILSCESVFKIAESLKVSQVSVGSVCQTNGIKIKNCQLGAF